MIIVFQYSFKNENESLMHILTRKPFIQANLWQLRTSPNTFVSFDRTGVDHRASNLTYDRTISRQQKISKEEQLQQPSNFIKESHSNLHL